MIRVPTLLLGLVLAAAATTAHASSAGQDLNVQNQPLNAQAAKIRTELADGETYSEITPADRDTVLGLLQQMETQLEAAGGVEAMSEPQQVELFNAQEQINTILTGVRADSRVICRRTQVTGSHRRQVNCNTVAELRRQREQSQQELEHRRRMTPCVGEREQCVNTFGTTRAPSPFP